MTDIKCLTRCHSLKAAKIKIAVTLELSTGDILELANAWLDLRTLWISDLPLARAQLQKGRIAEILAALCERCPSLTKLSSALNFPKEVPMISPPSGRNCFPHGLRRFDVGSSTRANAKEVADFLRCLFPDLEHSASNSDVKIEENEDADVRQRLTNDHMGAVPKKLGLRSTKELGCGLNMDGKPGRVNHAGLAVYI